MSLPSGKRDAASRTGSQNQAGPPVSGSASAAPPRYNPAAGRGRRVQVETSSSSISRSSDPPNHRRRGSGEGGSNSSTSRRGYQGGVGTGSSRDSSNRTMDYREATGSSAVSRTGDRSTVVVTNQKGERVDIHRNGNHKGSSGSAPRVVHRVGMECLSPINVARGEGPSTGGGVCVENILVRTVVDY